MPPSPDGGLIADYLGAVGDPAELAARLSATPGVVEHGLFPPELVSEVLVGPRRQRVDAHVDCAAKLAAWPSSPAASGAGASRTRAGASRRASTRPTTFRCSRPGPTPHTPLETWSFTIAEGGEELARWSWEEFRALPSETMTKDIHCVTKWSKLDTEWEGVSVDTLLDGIETARATSRPGATAATRPTCRSRT